jgi:hypothetical protein
MNDPPSDRNAAAVADELCTKISKVLKDYEWSAFREGLVDGLTIGLKEGEHAPKIFAKFNTPRAGRSP